MHGIDLSENKRALQRLRTACEFTEVKALLKKEEEKFFFFI